MKKKKRGKKEKKRNINTKVINDGFHSTDNNIIKSKNKMKKGNKPKLKMMQIN